jgi:hypothetical protein
MLQCITIHYNTKTGETDHVTMQHHTLQHQDKRNKSCYKATPYSTTPRQGEKSLYNTKPRPKSGIYKLHTGI